MSRATPNPRGAAFWNSTMGHAWVSQQAVISDVFTSVTSVSLVAAAAKQGEHVIDIGCGPGDTLLAFARAVGPSGDALGVDVSVPMLEFARHRAAEAGLANVTCALADATTYAFEPRRANLVYSRFGMMFFDDPVHAFGNLRRAARHGGGLCSLAWRSGADNPFMTTAERAAAPWLPELPPRKPGAPGQFAFADPDRPATVLRESGWTGIDIQPIDVACSLPYDELMHCVTWVGPVGHVLQQADDSTRARDRKSTRLNSSH